MCDKLVLNIFKGLCCGDFSDAMKIGFNTLLSSVKLRMV